VENGDLDAAIGIWDKALQHEDTDFSLDSSADELHHQQHHTTQE
jgi:hypothetical protein